MREEFTKLLSYICFCGITPAHAGRMYVTKINGEVVEDHPRACGKNFNQMAKARYMFGSPPRMREESYIIFKVSKT